MAGRDGGFEVRLGRIRSPSGSKKAVGFLKRVGRSAKFRGRRSRGVWQRAAARSQFHRRVTIKASFKRMDAAGASKLRRHLDYIERDGTDRNGGPARLYSNEGAHADKDGFVKRAGDDRHHFRFIVSPEDADELKNLTDFTRDLVSQMERDLDTKLDWVAANHYDTGQPHTHLILRGRRDDGRDLVIPREYISRGLRERAQELAELELGPVSEIGGRRRMARMVTQERLTELDRTMFRHAQDGVIDLAASASRGKLWMRQLEKRRLAHLATLGLADPLGKGRWRFAQNAEATLRRMGERGDIIKAMHQAMRDTGTKRALDAGAIFDPLAEDAKSVTGAVIGKGVADDVNDRAYLVVDTLDSGPRYVEIGSADNLENFRKGFIMTAAPGNRAPLPSDLAIARIASANNGRYDETLHRAADGSARPQFIEAHIRRLEAMRRVGHATRQPDGSWRIPGDYLDRAADFEKAKAGRAARIEIESRLPLRQMTNAVGATWLDQHLRDFDDAPNARGFAAELAVARTMRRRFLEKRGLLNKSDQRLSQATLDELRTNDLDAAGRDLASRLGKPYEPTPERGRIEGVYREAIDRPSGRFAVIERAKNFTLVPWRDVMERNRGKMVSGMIRGDGVSWRLTRGPTIS